MKKAAFFALLFSLITVSANAQWFDLNENNKRLVLGINGGVVGYNSVGELGEMDWADVGLGIGLNVAGVYLDFIYVSPDHMYDSHVVNYDWEDHDAFIINAGYQFPIYKNYVFVTPLIGWSRVSTGITEGNNIGVDPESRSIYHKYHSTWHRNDFNYGGMLTIAPCKYFEINAAFTAHGAYGGFSVNFANLK